MPEYSPEQDIAKGLADFRQGRKTFLTEFEIPTDDMPEEEQPEVSIERLTAYNLEQILKEINAEERLKDPDLLKQLIEDLNDDLERGKTSPDNASWACQTLSAIRFLGINFPGLNPEDLVIRINNPNLLKQLSEYLNDCLELGETNPNSASYACETLATISFLGINLPGLNPEDLVIRINNPNLLKQLTKGFNDDFEKGKTNPNFASYACETLYAIRFLGIYLPGLNPEDLITRINNPNFLERLTEDFNDDLERGKTNPIFASYACETLFIIRNIINYYSAIADEKEATQAAHRLKTAADRTGVPPRPEQKAF